MGGRNLDKIQEITGFFTNNAVVIGSHSDEFYTSVEQIENALNNDKWKEGRNYICRPVKEWFQCIPLSEKVFLVCGNIRLEMIFGSGDAGEAAQDYRAGLSEADVRVSVVWKLEKEQIHALHIHFSLPEEDFLPCRAEDLTGTAADEYHGSADRKEAAYYKKLSERDLMTGLYNRGSFENM